MTPGSMDQHKQLMEKFLETLTSVKTSPILKDDKYKEIIDALQNPCNIKDAHLRHKLKTKQYQLMDLPVLGVRNALVVPAKVANKKGEVSSAFLRVLPESEIYQTMLNVHANELKHAGYKKCREYVSTALNFIL